MRKASVVMATNSTLEKFQPAVLALKAQTYPNVEIVVVVDRACTSEEQVRFQTAHPDVVFVFLGAVHFLPAALNAGIAAASGEIIVRCDDDDICMPARIARQVQLLEQGNFDFVWSAAFGRRDSTDSNWLIPCPVDDHAIKQALLRRNVLVHSTLAGLKSAFIDVGLYNPSFIRSQDYELYLRAMRMNMRFGSVQDPLVTRYYGRDSITVRHRKGQILFSFAAQILHGANIGDVGYVLQKAFYYTALLIAPDELRSFRRWISTLTGKGR